MRLGGYVFYNGTDPEQYALAHVAKGFGAAVCPSWVSLEKPAELRTFLDAMKKHDVTIAEVGHGAIRCIQIGRKRRARYNT